MKNIRKHLLSFFTAEILLFYAMVSAFTAESSALAFDFVLPDDVLLPSEQSFRDEETGIWEMRRFLNGTIGAYITDLDSDGKQEMIDVYLRSPESGETTQIRIGIYEKNSTGNTVLRQEFMLCEFYASRMFDFDFKLSYFESDTGKYLISNEVMVAGSGIASNAHILSIGNDNKLYAVTSLFDPGYTSGIGLYQLHSISADKISELSYSGGDTLYEWNAGDSGEPSSQAYYSALNQALAPYGTSAAVSLICGAYFSDTPFIIQGETEMIAELGVDHNFQTKVYYARYSGNRPFSGTETDDAAFEPEKFYHKILTELRPKYTDSFCFLDLDGDGIEELLIGGTYLEFADQIIAVYTRKNNTDQPIQLFCQYNDSFNYHIYSGGIVSFNPSPNMHGQSYGKVLYQISDGQLLPVIGYLADGQTGKCYQTENKELLMLPLSYDFSKWNVISEDEFHQAINGYSLEPLTSNMTAFTEYDSQQKFDPEIFYQKILNQQRPSYATGSNGYAAGYRFLDLDEDGREELLICGHSGNNVWAPIHAIYTSKTDSDEPVYLDFTYNPYDGGFAGCFVSYTNGIGSTIWYSSGADLLPMSVQVLYRFSAGELIPICGYAEKENSERVFYTEDAEMLSKLEEYDYYEWNVGTQSDSKVKEIKALFEKTHDIKPYLYSFAAYDANREYQQIHPETIIPVSGTYGYDALLRILRGITAAPHRIKSVGYGTSALSTDNYSHLWLEYYLQGHLTDPCFVLRDLNADGTPELAVGCQEPDGTFTLFDLYTIYDNEIVHLASSSVRNTFALNEQNEIIESRFGGAMSISKIAYILENDRLEPIRAIQLDYSSYFALYNGGTAAESWETIPQSEYEAKSETEYSVLYNPEMFDLLTWNGETAISGDFNGDGTLSVADAVLLARFVAEDESLSDEQIDLILKAEPDQDSDGFVTISDVLYTLKICYL